MDIKHEKLCSFESVSKSGLGHNAYTHIYVYGTEDEINRITAYLEKNYIIHTQGSRFGEHEVHIWRHPSKTYALITPNTERFSEKACNEFCEKLKAELEKNYSDSGLTVVFGLDYVLDSEKIENFINNYEVDIYNLPLEKFIVIQPSNIGFPKIKESCLKRLPEIEAEVLSKLLNKKVIANKMEGRFKEIGHGRYGFFKNKAKTRYYPIGLNNLRTLDLNPVK